MNFTIPLKTSAICIAFASLIACGSGGVDGTSPPEPTPGLLSADQLQGRWSTSSGITPVQTAIVLPASGSAADVEMWLLATDLSSLARLSVSTSGSDGISATGKVYSLPSSATQPGQALSVSGTANLSNNTLSLNAGALLMTRSDSLQTPASQSAIAGAWSASAGAQAVTVALNISAEGGLSGPSSTGCTYSGQVLARSDASAYSVSLVEACDSGNTEFDGIATYRAEQAGIPAALTLALTQTDADQTQALVLALQR